MEAEPSILFVDDEPAILFSFRNMFENRPVLTAATPAEALELLSGQRADIMVVDYRMPGMNGLEFLEEAMRRGVAGRRRILLTAYADKELLEKALNSSLVHQLLEKPVDLDLLEQVLDAARTLCLTEQRRENELEKLRDNWDERRQERENAVSRVVGTAGGLAGVWEKLRQAAPHAVPVLLTGETGTGKELAALALHGMSPRAAGPFVAVNCAAIPDTLVESELFGHVKGAFTDAKQDRKGKLELAEGGTLFLDEVGELRPDVQAKLLRALAERQITRIGANETRTVDFRLVTATNRDLQAAIAEKQFRDDLYWRIAAYPVHLPRLVERLADLPDLLAHFTARAARELGIPAPGIRPGTVERLAAHGWPGNVRELENAVTRALITLGGRRDLEAWDFDFLGGTTAPCGYEAALHVLASEFEARQMTLETLEEDLIAEILARHGGNVSAAVAASGLSKNRFYRHPGRG